MNNLDDRIIMQLAMAPDQQIEGTNVFVRTLGYSNGSKHFICRKLRGCPVLKIIQGKRGHKTVYRLNRNSPGSPRKVRRS